MSTFPLVVLENQSNVHLLGTNILDLVCETYSMTQTVTIWTGFWNCQGFSENNATDMGQ